MPIEKRTRVEIFLPVRSDLSAYKIALEWLADELTLIRGGTTLTTPFAGLFASSTQIDVVQDAVRILFCDFDLNCKKNEDLKEIVIFLEAVKDFLKQTLQEEEIWIVFYQISRIV
ncbi:MAG: hypothetical protein ACR2GD_03780 [Pyrinomonadaceae bacterium]